MNIEEVEHSKVHKFFFPPVPKIPTDVIDKVAESFELTEDLTMQARELLPKLYKCFI